MNKTVIAPYKKLDLKIYGYTLPHVDTHAGCVKVGETTQRDVRDRILQQTATAGVKHELLFQRKALRSDGKLFHDKHLHKYFRLRGIERAFLNNRASEWFKFGDVSRAEQMTDDYIHQDYDAVQVSDTQMDYILRNEQEEAVQKTLEYKQDPIHGPEFLWNAKPRFGKTLTTYDFIRKIKAQNVLIVTNRPAIANSWFDDFIDFIAWQEPGMKFVSETDALADRAPMTREDYVNYGLKNVNNEDLNIRCVAFISLQDLKGARFAGGIHEKLEWVEGTNWDLLVVDEAHEGIDTMKTDRAFDKIKRKFTLHLSGTPFKALANQKFSTEQIYNWSYLDEQQAKAEWEDTEPGTNPYASLPSLNLFTYQMSKIIEQEVSKGLSLGDENNVDYAFDLNEFFKVKDDGSFIYEKDVSCFLDNLCAGKFPFAEGERRQELGHTLWLLPRVASAKALEKLLKKHPFFKDYEVVLAAGDGQSLQDDEEIDESEELISDAKRFIRSYDRVKNAIATKEKTITLSVSQLTTGVTIPEWTAVLMLSNIKSPALYFQASFRAQNPYEFQDKNTGEWFRKENAYVFDFAPDRTLQLFDAFANNLSDEGLTGDIEERKDNIRKLINFFPVIAEDEQGTMVEISPEDVLTFPNRIKAAEVVKRGFMSNLLFANISAIFSASAELKAIIDKISPEKNARLGNKREIKVNTPMLNSQGEVEIDPTITISTTNGLFGAPIYETDVEATLQRYADLTDRAKVARQFARDMVSQLQEGFVNTREEFDLPKKVLDRDTKKAEKMLEVRVEENLYQRQQKERQAKQEYEREIQNIEDHQIREERTNQYEAKKKEIQEAFLSDVKESVEIVTRKVVETHIENREEDKKKTTEDDVRDHLRGFARTIPAFLMAYGSAETTLANFDQNIDPATFEELTSITLDEFRKLRDGFEYVDEKGETRSFNGLFNEVVFNASVVEFFRLKAKLADYLHTEEEEDIFDYIPPQKTNQIFTPRRVVKMMVDLLEQNDPGIFGRKETTFIDLYAKSGLYLTEITKRLFKGLQQAIPDEKERVKWILENQVYGCAPSNIIYNMVKNYVYAGYPEIDNSNLLELDMTEAAKQGCLTEVLAERLGKKMKFDVVIGNPPYQESDGGHGASAVPVYQYFIQGAQELRPRYLSMITPSRWFTGGRGLDNFRDEMLHDKRISVLHDFPDASLLFPDVEIKGGVNYFLWDRENSRECNVFTHYPNRPVISSTRFLLEPGMDIFIRDIRQITILRKIQQKKEAQFFEIMSANDPFGYDVRVENSYTRVRPTYSLQPFPGSLVFYYFGWRDKGVGYIKRNTVRKGFEYIDSYKVFIPRAWGVGDTSTDKIKAFIGEPGTVSTETYSVIGPFKSREEAGNVLSYLNTKFFHFLVSIVKITQAGAKHIYKLVPMQDFSITSDIDWTQPVGDIDQQLYKKYDLTSEEIEFIGSEVLPME